jgi:hypothetical protein
MMCYKDMTFCRFYKDCAKADDCPRAYTDEVQAAAELWWGGEDAPVAFYMGKPSCHTPREESDG